MDLSRFATATPRRTPTSPEVPERRGASGFPPPADDYRQAPLSLDRHLVPHPASTFFMRVNGRDLEGNGFRHGDLLIVDRAITPVPGQWVVATIDGALTLQRLEGQGTRRWLCSGDTRQARLPLDDDRDTRLWGLVCHVIHDCRHEA